MSSLRRTLSSRANGALSRGPVTIDGKKRSALNALSHGLLARTTLMRGEWADGLKNVFNKYVDRLAPVDFVEYGYVEEMVAACWRLRRLWAIETRTLDNEADAQDADDPVDRMAAAFALLAEKPHPDLLHRYEMRMHLTYQRALQNLILLRIAGKNEPSPISGHSAEPRPAEAPEPLQSRARQQAVVPVPNEPSPISGQSHEFKPVGAPESPVAPTPPSSPEEGRASAGAGLEPGSRLRPKPSRAENILANCRSQQSEAATPPVEPAVLPATPAVVPADGDCGGRAEPPRLPGGQAQPNPCAARLHLTYQRDLCSLPLLRTAGTNEPSPISGQSDPEPTAAPKPPVFQSRACQQPSFPPRRAPPGCIPPSPRRPISWSQRRAGAPVRGAASLACHAGSRASGWRLHKCAGSFMLLRMRMTINLPDELLRSAKLRAADEHTTVRQVVETALRQHLAGRPRNSKFKLCWRTESGRLRPGVRLDDGDALFDLMDGRP